MNIPNVEKVSKFVGWDGETYYCLGCFDSGFPTPYHVNGHQSVCPARHPERQIPTTPSATPTPYPISANLGGGGGGGDRGTPLPPIQDIKTQNTFTLPTPNMLLPSKTNTEALMRMMTMQGQKIDRIEKQVTNEWVHAIATRQQIGGIGNFIETHKDFLIGLGIGILIGWLLNEMLKTKNYSSPVYNRLIDNGRRGKGSSFGYALANRAASKAIDYGINRLLK